MSAIAAVESGENPIPTHTHATMNLLKWKKKESAMAPNVDRKGQRKTGTTKEGDYTKI